MFREAVWCADPEIIRLDPQLPGEGGSADVVFAVETLQGRHIGLCRVYQVTALDAEVGIMIGDKAYWNQGYGREVMEELAAYCFDELHLPSVWLKALVGNVRAIRCYQHAGFTLRRLVTAYGYEFMVLERRNHHDARETA